MNLYQKLAKIRKMTGVLQRTKQGFGYKYVPEDEVLAKISAGMEKYNVSLVPMIKSDSAKVEPYKYTSITIDKKTKERTEKDVYEIIVTADMKFKWVDDDNPEDFIEVEWLLTGQQSDSSQAFGSGLTYCQRYFLLKYFQVATVTDDPDNWRSKKKEAEESERKELLKELHSEILKTCVTKSESGIDKDLIYKTIADNNDGKKNPNSIKDIELAKKILEIIKNMEVS